MLTRQRELKIAHIQAEFGVDGCGLGDLTQVSKGLGKEDVDGDEKSCQAGWRRALHRGIENMGPHEETGKLMSTLGGWCTQAVRAGWKEKLKLAPGSYVAASVSNLKVVAKDNQARGFQGLPQALCSSFRILDFVEGYRRCLGLRG